MDPRLKGYRCEVYTNAWQASLCVHMHEDIKISDKPFKPFNEGKENNTESSLGYCFGVWKLGNKADGKHYGIICACTFTQHNKGLRCHLKPLSIVLKSIRLTE